VLLADSGDAVAGGVQDFPDRVAGQVGQLHILEVGPQPLHRVQVVGVAGQVSTASQWRWPSSQARISRLWWAGRLSHTSVTGAPRRKRRNCRSTPISVWLL
jgi:hypothetical protein